VPLAQTESGIVYPAEGMDGARIRAALKEHDRNLDLIQQLDPDWGRWVYKVTYSTGSGDEVLFAWRGANGEPLELSSALLDKVKRLDKNTSVAAPDADALNDRHLKSRKKDWDDSTDDLVDDYLPRSRRKSLLPRTRDFANRRWKERQYQLQQQRLRETR
jgi:hypothetical protein